MSVTIKNDDLNKNSLLEAKAHHHKHS